MTKNGRPYCVAPASSTLRDVRMIHHRQRLPLLLEARDDLLRIHPHLDDLQRHAPPHRLLLLRHPHRAEAALADLLAQLVRPDPLAGFLRLEPRQLALDLRRKRRASASRPLAPSCTAINRRTRISIAGSSPHSAWMTLRAASDRRLERSVEDRFDAVVGWIHGRCGGIMHGHAQTREKKGHVTFFAPRLSGRRSLGLGFLGAAMRFDVHKRR